VHLSTESQGPAQARSERLSTQHARWKERRGRRTAGAVHAAECGWCCWAWLLRMTKVYLEKEESCEEGMREVDCVTEGIAR
jgi:hypothetical protein